jgi:hypothetical protein
LRIRELAREKAEENSREKEIADKIGLGEAYKAMQQLI